MKRSTPALAAYIAGRGPLLLGHRRNGRPIFAIAGGAPDDPTAGGGNDDPPEPGKQDPPEFTAITSQDEFDRRLSDRLQRERAKFSDYGDLKKKAEEFDKAQEAAQSEQEKAVAAARKEGEQTATERANSRLIAAEARAQAASARFRNPAAAVKLADLSSVSMNDDGEVDTTALKAALDALAKSDPYLIEAESDGKPPRPRPDPSQGGGGSKGDKSVSAGRELYAQRHQKTSA